MSEARKEIARARTDARKTMKRCTQLLTDGSPFDPLALEEARSAARLSAAWLSEAIEDYDLDS